MDKRTTKINKIAEGMADKVNEWVTTEAPEHVDDFISAEDKRRMKKMDKDSKEYQSILERATNDSAEALAQAVKRQMDY